VPCKRPRNQFAGPMLIVHRILYGDIKSIKPVQERKASLDERRVGEIREKEDTEYG